MNYLKTLGVSTFLLIFASNQVLASSFEEYVQILSDHPQVQSIIAQSDATKEQAKGELGLPDPMFMIGVDNVPVSDPAFDRFLPTSKVIGFNQSIPNPALRNAKADKFEQISEKQKLIADYTRERLKFMLVSKLATYESIKTQKKLIKRQLGYYKELENTFKGQIESGSSVYQRFSEVDVERAEAERKLNDLDAQKITLEAEFIRLVGEIPNMTVPNISNTFWDKKAATLYPVLIAAEDITIAEKEVGIADAAFLPNFGVNALYKQREDSANNSYSGDDWFSVQAQVSIPLWSSSSQKPKLRAAKKRKQSATFAYDDVQRLWIQEMAALQSVRDAAGKNVKVLQDKDWAMKGKIDAVQRNYEAGTSNLDSVLLAKIDRLNIQAQLAQVKAVQISKAAELNSNIIDGLQEIK